MPNYVSLEDDWEHIDNGNDNDNDNNNNNNNNNFKDLAGDWQPEVIEDDPDFTFTLSDLEKDWIKDFSNQIQDLEALLDKDVIITTKNYINKKITISFKHDHTFIIEMQKKPDESETLENNVYVKDNDIPIYTENISDINSEVIGNFWMSFLEYGLKPYLITNKKKVISYV